MSNYLNKRVLLVGAGTMALDYAKVLKEQNITFEVVGRGAESAVVFTQEIGIEVHTGGLKEFLEKAVELPPAAIVAVGVEQLAEATLLLLEKGIKQILVEKPAGLNIDEISQVAAQAEVQKSLVYVAYNRRFYTSTIKAQEIIREDGGVTSFIFEFTEWSHVIEDLKKADDVKQKWFLANSTHVVDLAFYLGGRPKKICCHTAGGLSWHPSASIFTGSGVSQEGVPFSYHANWEAPGRWSLEILTRRHRLIFRPMEQLHIQRFGSVSIEKVELDDELDVKFKPGLFRQVKAFLGADKQVLIDIKSQYDMCKTYELIANSNLP